MFTFLCFKALSTSVVKTKNILILHILYDYDIINKDQLVFTLLRYPCYKNFPFIFSSKQEPYHFYTYILLNYLFLDKKNKIPLTNGLYLSQSKSDLDLILIESPQYQEPFFDSIEFLTLNQQNNSRTTSSLYHTTSIKRSILENPLYQFQIRWIHKKKIIATIQLLFKPLLIKMLP